MILREALNELAKVRGYRSLYDMLGEKEYSLARSLIFFEWKRPRTIYRLSEWFGLPTEFFLELLKYDKFDE